MKRPSWLGGADSEENDRKTVAKSEPKETAAERSARRTKSKQALGARVGEGGEAPPKQRPGGKPKAKPARPKSTTPKADQPKAKSAKPKADQPKADEAKSDKRELHRPRRQSDGKRTAEKPGRKREKATRKPIRPRAAAASRSVVGSLKKGGSKARKGTAAAVPKFGRLLMTGAGVLFGAFFSGLGFILGILIAVARFLARPIGFLLGKLSRMINAISRVLTPVRVLALVVAGAAVLLALSQYADFRSISIGNGAYAEGLQAVAPAPETGRLPTGDAHSYVFVPIAIACLLLLVGSLFGRWRLCRLISLAGLAAVVVALVVDRPAGLDLGDAALAFDGASAALLGGFYAQIAAGILLVTSSSLLAHELRLAGARAPARKRRNRRESHEPSRRRPGPARA